MLVSKTVKIKWCSKTKKHYVNLGYVYTKMGDEFEVDVNHLNPGSHAIVKWECDGGCGEIITGEYRTYLKCVKEDGKIYCHKCVTKLFAIEKGRKTKLKNGTSFEQWCIDNNELDVLSRWDYDKNNCLPSEISYSSSEPRWFKCDKHPDTHHSELKSLNNFVHGHNGCMDCKQCNSVAQSIIDLYGEEKLYDIWNSELNGDINPWEISSGSDEEYWFNCIDGIHEPFLRKCNNFKRSKYKCCKCYRSIKGKDHYNYNPNLSDEDREDRRNIEGYKEFIKDVMARDNYTCQITGIISNGDNLVVHHLNGYHWDKENRTNPDNGIVIHEEIHKLFHKLYGRENNTLEQFNEFLELIENDEIDITEYLN